MRTPRSRPWPASGSATSSRTRPTRRKEPGSEPPRPGRRRSGRQVAVEVPHQSPGRRKGPVPADHRVLPGRDQAAAHLVPRRAGNPARETAPRRHRPGAGVLAFLDWLQAGRGNSASTRNQRLAVIKSFARYTAIERPEFLGQATRILAVRQQKTPAGDMGHLTGSEVKALLAEPDPATRRGLRDMVLLSTL